MDTDISNTKTQQHMFLLMLHLCIMADFLIIGALLFELPLNTNLELVLTILVMVFIETKVSNINKSVMFCDYNDVVRLYNEYELIYEYAMAVVIMNTVLFTIINSSLDLTLGEFYFITVIVGLGNIELLSSIARLKEKIKNRKYELVTNALMK